VNPVGPTPSSRSARSPRRRSWTPPRPHREDPAGEIDPWTAAGAW